MRECACGCGGRTAATYIHGHNGRRYPEGQLCNVETCDNLREKKDLCGAHYRRVKTGRDFTKPLRPHGLNWDEALAYYSMETEHGTVWVGTVREDGYGLVSAESTQNYVHRVAWELTYGPIPSGYEVDHSPGCPKNCITIDHLSLLTKAEHSAVGWERGELDGGWGVRRAGTS